MKIIPMPRATAGTSWRQRGSSQAESFWDLPVPPMKFYEAVREDRRVKWIEAYGSIVDPETDHNTKGN
jgi:hypothetical protein